METILAIVFDPKFLGFSVGGKHRLGFSAGDPKQLDLSV